MTQGPQRYGLGPRPGQPSPEVDYEALRLMAEMGAESDRRAAERAAKQEREPFASPEAVDALLLEPGTQTTELRGHSETLIPMVVKAEYLRTAGQGENAPTILGVIDIPGYEPDMGELGGETEHGRLIVGLNEKGVYLAGKGATSAEAGEVMYLDPSKGSFELGRNSAGDSRLGSIAPELAGAATSKVHLEIGFEHGSIVVKNKGQNGSRVSLPGAEQDQAAVAAPAAKERMSVPWLDEAEKGGDPDPHHERVDHRITGTERVSPSERRQILDLGRLAAENGPVIPAQRTEYIPVDPPTERLDLPTDQFEKVNIPASPERGRELTPANVEKYAKECGDEVKALITVDELTKQDRMFVDEVGSNFAKILQNVETIPGTETELHKGNSTREQYDDYHADRADLVGVANTARSVIEWQAGRQPSERFTTAEQAIAWIADSGAAHSSLDRGPAIVLAQLTAKIAGNVMRVNQGANINNPYIAGKIQAIARAKGYKAKARNR